MRWIEINKSGPLYGSVSIPGSKNSSLGLLAACCLSNEVIKLSNIPDISDIKLIMEIGSQIGLIIKQVENGLIIDPTRLYSAEIPLELSSSYRASYYFVGALLSKFGKVKIGYPGGDNFGSRPIDQHVKGFEALGAKINFYENYYTVEAKKLVANDIYFDVITCGATINIMLAAVLAEGKTTLRNAAKDPEVVDVAVLLNKMGARIRGAGTDIIHIEGQKHLKKCSHSAIPDRLIAGTFIMAAAITKGTIKVDNIIPEHLNSCISKLKEAGMDFETGEDYILANGEESINGVSVQTDMYPGFASDLQQPLTTLLVSASNHSIIKEKIYPGRINHCIELNKMGANIIIRNERIIVPGNRRLHGADVHASDIRAGISLILAGLIAQGTTYMTGVEHIERGYTDIIRDLVNLGAKMELKVSHLCKNA